MGGILSSCKDMMDDFKKYTKDGEINYVGKMDFVNIYSGNGRVLFTGLLVSDRRITGCTIYWDGRSDSIKVPIVKTIFVDTLRTFINIPQGIHNFEIRTFDEFGHTSVPVYAIGTSYGEVYRSSLQNRSILEVNKMADEGFVTISWASMSSVSGVNSTIIRYTDNNGIVKEITSPISATNSVLSDYKSGTSVQYRTSYVPDAISIDTLYTDFKDISIVELAKVSKTDWKITGFSSEEKTGEGPPNGWASAVIDGNLSTFWHTQWSGASPGYPHWFILDMGKEVAIAFIEVFRRQGNGGGQTKHQFLYSNNGTDWTNFGTFSMNGTIDSGQKFKSTITSTTRYIKYVALEGPNFYAFLAELNVYSPI